MNVMEILMRLAASGATVTIDGEGEDDPTVIVITDGNWRRSRCLMGGPSDLPLEFERVVAQWEEHRAA